jgi:manganese/zinc/iron transport system permease protein
MGAIVVVSLLLAPNRGLLWAWWRRHRTSRRLRRERVLCLLYTLARKHGRADYAHDAATLDAMATGSTRTTYVLRRLAEDGLVAQTREKQWHLTERGTEQARLLAEDRNLVSESDTDWT